MPTIALALLLLASPRPATTNNQQVKELVETIRFIEAHKRDQRAAIGLWSLPEVWGLADPQLRARIDGLLEGLAEDPKTPLAIRRLAAELSARRLSARGLTVKAASLRSKQGWIREWWLAGPFDDSLGDGMDRIYPPEAQLDLQAPMPSKSGSLRWRPPVDQGPGWQVRLHPRLLPRNRVVAYALTVLELPRAQRVLVHLGCDDGCKLWVNGAPIIEDPGPHPLRPDQRSASMTLPAGANRLLLKVLQDAGAMEFGLSISDPRGRPIPGLKVVAEAEALGTHLKAAKPKEPLRVRQETDLASWFSERALAGSQDPQALAEAGWALYHTASDDRRKSEAKQMLEQALAAIQPESKDPSRLKLWLARVTDDENQSRRLLHDLSRTRPDDPRAWARISLLHQVRGEAQLALRAVDRALAAQPAHLPSRVARAELLQDLGLRAAAEREMGQLVDQHPRVPEVLTAAANLARREGDSVRALGLLKRLLAEQSDNHFALRGLHELALERGELKGALAHLTALQGLDPLRVNWWLQRGRLLAENGRIADAQKSIDKAVAICPADPHPWVVRGEVQLKAGREAAALEDWQRALSLAPQDHALQRRIQALQPRTAPFYQAWRIDPRSLIGQPEPKGIGGRARRLADVQVVRLHPNGMASRFHQQLVRVDSPGGVERFRAFRIEYAPGRQEVRVLASRVWHPDGSTEPNVLVDDHSLSEPWYNLYYDVHARVFTFPDLNPGDLVELTTLVEDLGGSALLTNYFGDLVPLQFTDPVSQSIYVLLSPPKRSLAFSDPPAGIRYSLKTAQDGSEVHQWQGRDLPGVRDEPAMPGFTETRAHLHISTMSDWGNLSRWFEAQISDQLITEAPVRELAKRLTEGLSTPKQKIRAIYRFVADSTRYVGLEFGIHSYVPYRASQVLKRKFGDCKDKSALLVSLFDAIGIEAHLALVRMQRLGRFDQNDAKHGPASLAVFNHAICHLPAHGLWLDGTAALHDIYDLPAQDQGIQALVIGPQGNLLVETPRTGVDRNWTDLQFDIEPQVDGTAKMAVRLGISGVLAPEMRLRLLGGRDRREVLGEIISEIFPSALIHEAQVENLTDPSMPLQVKLQIELQTMGWQRDGGLELAVLGKDTNYQRMLAAAQSRSHDLLLGPVWAIRWKVNLQAPGDLEPSRMPKGGTIETAFGKAELRVRRDGKTIRSQASFELATDRVPAAAYPAFRDFLGKVDRLFSSRVRFAGGENAS